MQRLEKIGQGCQPHDASLKATGNLLIQGSLASSDDWKHFVPKDGTPVKVEGKYLKGIKQAGAFLLLMQTIRMKP